MDALTVSNTASVYLSLKSITLLYCKMAEALAIVETVQTGVDAANGALNLYNNTVNQLIPWDTFKQAMKDLKENSKQYSDKSAVLVGKVQTLLLNSSDEYDSSLEEVNRWCKMAVPVLGQFMSLFEKITDSNVAQAQKILLLKVLNEGSEHLTRAISKLEASKMSFNEASGHLITLVSQLEHDFNAGSAFYLSAVAELRAQAYGGAAVGAAFGPLGLALSYSIAAGVVEGSLIPSLVRAFQETLTLFNNLKTDVEKTQKDIESAKESITNEIRALGTMSGKIEETKTFAETWSLIPSVLFGDLKKSTNQLIDMCKQYIVAAEEKIDEK